MQLDLIDIRILRHLTRNGKMTNNELAEAVSLSASACFRRVKLLEEAGIISGYHCEIAAKALGVEFEALVQVSMRTDVERWHENFVQALNDWPEVVTARVVSGPCNYVLTVRARDLAHYSDFVVNRLHKSPGVMSINSNIVLATLKQAGSLLDLVKIG
ncbi:AsnC family transcriptional regulator [Cupriavidus basilensis OR16]|uniref:AsnC family transcriptional regulator n=1 Tax=Cupriavidus basilensis OR16 TaxID=1127483 RepID=H1S350_9BURK|nr:Lrp/AsnC family transcriptional regulator [Cupriavidus basilensis]EHP43058.1 AsnC family transcriptional regulator [Cupriavidus basilensis OR16]